MKGSVFGQRIYNWRNSQEHIEEYNLEFLDIKYYLSEIKSYLYELQQYNVNFFQEGSSGNISISHMIMNKLPKIVVTELINKIDNNYPSLEQIFNRYNEFLKTLIRTVSGREDIKNKKVSSGNNIKKDSLSLVPFSLDEANTKRQVLSQISKVYDPLNFILPVTIRGRLLKRRVWKLDMNWDQKVPKEISDEMKVISKDFEMLTELSFPRIAINENESYGLHIFCDSSTEAYGFVMYTCTNEKVSSFYLLNLNWLP